MSRWALFTSAGYFFYRMAKQYLRLLKPEEQKHIGPGTDLEKCPRCYTYVPIDTAMRSSIGGNTVHFCSPECLEAYRRDQQGVDDKAIEPGNGKFGDT